MKESKQVTSARQELANILLDMWEYELGGNIEDAWFADDDAKVIALNNIREYLIDIILNT